MTFLIKHQLLHQSIAKRNISSLTQVKPTIPSKPHCVVFLGQYQASIMNHQFLSQLSIFLSFFSLCFLVHPIIICIYISFFRIQCRSFFCSHSFKNFVLFISSISAFDCSLSLYICYIDRRHGLFEMTWCFLLHFSPYIRQISMCHTYYLICINQKYFPHSVSRFRQWQPAKVVFLAFILSKPLKARADMLHR